MGAACGTALDEPRSRMVRRRLRVAAAALLAVAGGMFVLRVVAWSAFPRVSPAMLPPAGESIEGKAPFRFAYMADGRGNLDVLEAIFERVKADKVSLVLYGGDMVMEPATEDFEWLLHELDEAKLGVPFCAVPGNHDVCHDTTDQANRYRLYSRSFGPRQYWFAYANALFVAVDTAEETCTEHDLRWLDRTLARHRANYEACIVFTHVPIRDPRANGASRCLASGSEALARILAAHRVTALFASHIHSYLEDSVEGIPVYISGGAGADRSQPILPHHYLLCAVEPGGKLRVERKDVESNSVEDYWEHKLLVKWPRRLGVIPVLVLAAAGIVLWTAAAAPWRRRAADRAAASRS
mgnify:CR=1 FL=1